MNKAKEAIELLEKAEKTAANVASTNYWKAVDIGLFNQALTLLSKASEPKCKTCGDTGQVEYEPDDIQGDIMVPCPDCQQPLIGEFTKNTRINFTVHFENPDWVIHKKLMEACDIIDTETQRADKAEAKIRLQTDQLKICGFEAAIDKAE